MLHRDPAPEWEGITRLLLRKNRNGPTGETLLGFDGPRMRLCDYDGDAPIASADRTRQKRVRAGFDG